MLAIQAERLWRKTMNYQAEIIRVRAVAADFEERLRVHQNMFGNLTTMADPITEHILDVEKRLSQAEVRTAVDVSMSLR